MKTTILPILAVTFLVLTATVFADVIAVSDGDDAPKTGELRVSSVYQLTVTVVGGNGTVEPNSGSYPEGTVVTLTAIPDPGYYLKYWMGTDDDSSYCRTNTVTMDSDKTVIVEFTLPRVIEVTGGGDAIVDAVGMATNGDILVVAAGTYNGGINFSGKSIRLASTNPDDPFIVENTIIDGGGAASCIMLSGCEEESVIVGLTIINGNTTGNGGGICANGAEVVITNCIITNNHADGSGGGISDCRRPIRNCTISDNSAEYGAGIHYELGTASTLDYCTLTGNTASYGGGMHLMDCNIAVSHCDISYNTARRGGGLYAIDSPETTVSDCTIRGNQAQSDGVAHGGGMYCSFGPRLVADCRVSDNTAATSGGGLYVAGSGPAGGPEVRNCLVTNNAAGRDGGGISCNWYAEPTITNCTIAGNEVTGVPGYGGGLHCSYESTVEVVDSIIWANAADEGSQIALCGGDLHYPLPSAAEISYSDIGPLGDPNVIYIEQGSVMNGWDPGSNSWDPATHNIAADPCFIGGHYLSQLAAGPDNQSFCVDAGSDLAANLGMDTYTTRTDGVDDTAIVDMGYHYSEGVTLYELTVTVVGGQGSVEPSGGVYLEGTIVTLTATPNEGYCLMRWTGTDDDSSYALTNTVTMTEDKTVTVEFRLPHSYYVPGEYQNIQEAINAAQNCDVVVVAAGMHHENISFNGKSITVTSQRPDDPRRVAATIINGTGAGPTVTFSGSENESCVLNGLTITGGNTTGHGGGICGNGTEATITNCVIRNNHADGSGGGVSDCNGIIAGCEISDNYADEYGGGIVCFGSSPTITHCIIKGNEAPHMGGGLFCWATDALVSHCVITANLAGGLGGGVYLAGIGSPELINSLVTNNTTPGEGGGGISSNWYAKPTITNCTVANNTATYGYGGGLNCCYESEATLINSILWGNTGLYGPQIAVAGREMPISRPSVLAVSSSDIQGGQAAVYVADGSTLNWDGGNIDSDPQFLDSIAGDWHLGPGSPCIDAGDNNAVPPSLVKDLDGNPRIANGTVDMGVDEVPVYELTVVVHENPVDPGIHGVVEPNGGSYFAGTVVTLTAIPDPNYYLKYWMGTDDDSSYCRTNTVTMDSNKTVIVQFKLPRVIEVSGGGDAIVDAVGMATNGDILVVAAGVYNGGINFSGKSITLVSMNPDDPMVVESTIIDGGGSGSCVTFSGCESESVIDGFTITDGNTTGNGGGICGNGAKVWICNCIITNNHADGVGGGVSDCTRPIRSCSLTDNSAEYGGGIYYDVNTASTLMDCTLAGNTASKDGGGIYLMDSNIAISDCYIGNNTAAGRGGGLHCVNSPETTIARCTIRDNDANGGGIGDGGGMFCWVGPRLITDCHISDNNATTSGGGVYVAGADDPESGGGPQLRQCLVTNNTAGRDGGGLSCNWYAELTITNCTIADNTVNDGYGGGLYCSYESDATVTNSILWGNTGLYGSQMAITSGDPFFPWPSALTISYSDAEGGQGAAYVEPGCTLNWGAGNIDSDPLLVDPTGGDWRLGPGSPCIDAGDNTAVPPAMVTDLDGNPRIINEVVDMGPYEMTYYYVDGLSGDDDNDGRSPETAFATIQKGIDSAEQGCVVLVYPAEYLQPDPWEPESISFPGKSIKVTGADPTDSDVVKNTVIRGIVEFSGTEDPNCIFTGFSIRDIANGAIYGNHTHATISHCIISGNGPCTATVVENCDGTISNCLITDNLTIYRCGVYPVILGCHGLIKNCTIANNASGIGILDGGTTTIQNSIIYYNADPNNPEPQISVGSGATLNISYCDLQGGLGRIHSEGEVNWGLGNIDSAPCFVRLGDWDYEPWPWELTEGNYHLQSEGWRLSEYGPYWVYDDVTSRGIDAGNPGSRLRDELISVPRDPDNEWGINVRINMGAYGGTPEASMAPPNWPLLADLNNDGIVDWTDLSGQMEDWLERASEQPGDLNRDGVVDTIDFAILAEQWRRSAEWRVGDTLAPVPHPYLIIVDPVLPDSITMVASTAYDMSGVEYYFACTSGGGHDSGWQDETDYTDVGLFLGIEHCYKVRARDKSPNRNETGWSQVACATIPWDPWPPTPDPMRWDETVDANGFDGRPREIWLGLDPIWDHAVTMRADPNTFDQSGFEFYFECVDRPGTWPQGFDSGWVSFPGPPYTYTVLVGQSGLGLRFHVKARDCSPNHNETAWSQTWPALP